jgi:YcxB-like protein
MAVTVAFTLTRADVLRGSWVSLRSHPFILAQSIGFFIALPWAIAVWQLVEAARGEAYASTSAIVEMVLIPPLAAVGFGAIPLWISRGSRLLGGQHKFEFTEQDVHLTGPTTDSRIQWSAFTKCYGTRHGILFYSGNQPTLSIPGRALAPEAAAKLREMLTARGIKIVGPWARASILSSPL